MWSNNYSIKPLKNNPISNFDYTDIEGHSFSLYQHKGKTVFLHFWATWCAPCITELPKLVELAKNTPADLVILAISKDLKEADIRKFLTKQNIAPPQNIKFIWDKNSQISEGIFSVTKLPETFILNQDLSLKEKIIGDKDDWKNYFEN